MDFEKNTMAANSSTALQGLNSRLLQTGRFFNSEPPGKPTLHIMRLILCLDLIGSLPFMLRTAHNGAEEFGSNETRSAGRGFQQLMVEIADGSASHS